MLFARRHSICIVATNKKSDEAIKAMKKQKRKAWEKDQKEAALRKKQLQPNRKVSYIEREDGIWEERRQDVPQLQAPKRETIKPCKPVSQASQQEKKKTDTKTEKERLKRRDELKRAGYRKGIFPLHELLAAKLSSDLAPPPEWVEAEIRHGMSPLGEEPWIWIKEGFGEDEDSFTLPSEEVSYKGRRVALPSQPWKDLKGLREYKQQRRQQQPESLD